MYFCPTFSHFPVFVTQCGVGGFVVGHGCVVFVEGIVLVLGVGRVVVLTVVRRGVVLLVEGVEDLVVEVVIFVLLVVVVVM